MILMGKTCIRLDSTNADEDSPRGGYIEYAKLQPLRAAPDFTVSQMAGRPLLQSRSKGG